MLLFVNDLTVVSAIACVCGLALLFLKTIIMFWCWFYFIVFRVEKMLTGMNVLRDWFLSFLEYFFLVERYLCNCL